MHLKWVGNFSQSLYQVSDTCQSDFTKLSMFRKMKTLLLAFGCYLQVTCEQSGSTGHSNVSLDIQPGRDEAFYLYHQGLSVLSFFSRDSVEDQIVLPGVPKVVHFVMNILHSGFKIIKLK